MRILHLLSKLDMIQNLIKCLLVLSVVEKSILPHLGHLRQLLPLRQERHQIIKVGFRHLEIRQLGGGIPIRQRLAVAGKKGASQDAIPIGVA